jgi:molybdopterin-containing oxidoreductase family iron-sulfur binding subunit
MANNKKYWVGIEELENSPEFLESQKNEFSPSAVSVDTFLSETNLGKTSTNRRDFLKFLGFSVTSAAVAACETPVINSIPYVNKPETITPGVPTYYASTYFDGHDYASIVVKTREGRPILIKGNAKHGLNQGSVTARINSSVLSLYDGTRLKGPRSQEGELTWSDADTQIGKELADVAASGGRIAILTGTVMSPSTTEAINGFKAAYAGARVDHVQYDAWSTAAIRKANERSFGEAAIPDYDFSKAKVIVSLGADFLDNWLMPTQFIGQYSKNRNPQSDWMSKHYQIESRFSLTGSNADKRIAILPSQEAKVALAIHNEVAKLTGAPAPALNTEGLPMEELAAAANDLYKNRGKSLFVSGSNDPDVQVVVNATNVLLGNYGSTISQTARLYVKQGDDAAVAALIADMKAGKVNALLIHGDINPAYSLPNAADFVEGLSKVGTSVSFSRWADETASRCKYMCPDHHYLESWNDYHPKTGHYALAQPTINALYNTRQFQDTLLKWSGNTLNYHDFMREVWQRYSQSMASEAFLFDDFWYNALRNGSISVSVEEQNAMELNPAEVQEAASKIASTSTSGSGFELSLYTSVGIGDGTHATNPWLQELPDPISKITWDNYIAMNPADAEANGFNTRYSQEEPATLAKLTLNGMEVVLPVVAQPGQKRGAVSVALGYGRGSNQEEIGKAAYRTKEYGGYEQDADGKKIPIGKNAYPLVGLNNGFMQYTQSGVTIEPAGGTYPIASTQIQHTIMGRDSVLKETSFAFFKSSPKEAYNPPHELPVHEDGKTVMRNVDEIDIWNEHPVKGVGHRWGMSIDLSTCIGCSACVTACHSENNVPVVGKDEIRRGRDMHWMRIDRYYSSEMNMERGAEEGKGVIDTYRDMEIAEYDNPSTVFMPMMCQHCNHAPCETVCPVAATTHSNEGLNQMTYNRCIGTRYCANNCPFKVRRFNWFNYKAYDKFSEVNPAQDAMARLVLNPDVTVRSRGVMEKCSMCVQRIQAGKLEAKIKGMPVEDGSVVTACAEACPTHAITFGDLNDTASKVAQAETDNRSYHALAEVGIKPNVSYKVKVRNS